MDEVLKEAVEKDLLTRLVTFGFDKAKSYLSRSGTALESTEDRVETAIQAHCREVASWSSQISFKDLQRPRSTSEVYVPLDIYLLPRRSRFSLEEALVSAPLEEILSSTTDHVVILGQPGAGKTTSVRHLCQQMLTSDRVSSANNFPIIVRLRDLNTSKSPTNSEDSDLILDRLQQILELDFGFPEYSDLTNGYSERRAIRERTVLEFLDSLGPLILLDGLDEVSHKKKRDAIVDEIRRLAPRLEKARVILTARTGEFNYHIERMRTFEIAPLSAAQIKQFAQFWLGPEEAMKFIAQVKASPFSDTAIKPLTLAHLCAIYERVQKIPDKPKSVYKKIVKLLLEEWDQQRSVKRESAYANFDVDRKEDFLADLAHSLTASQKTSVFSRYDLLNAYLDIFDNYALPKTEAQEIVNELETHTGLLVQSGVDLFEFSHKSLQEFLTASFIVGLVSIPSNMVELQLMPNELAIATALSSRPAEYFTKLITQHFANYKLSFSFIRTYLTRLLIERPDFEGSEEVGIALLLLYSKYLQAFLAEADQLQLYIVDELEMEFAQMGDMIRNRISLQEVLKAYDAYSHAFSMDGEQIWRLQRKRHPRGVFSLLARANVLPKTLWVRNTLLSAQGVTVETLKETPSKKGKGRVAHI